MDWIHKSTPFMEPSNLAKLVQGNVPLQPHDSHSSLTDLDMDLREVYFLILHFLSIGPCERTFGHLRDEILEKGLLPRRYHSWWSRSGIYSGRADDDGISLPLSYDNLIERYPHIEKDHLVKLLKQLILNPSFPSHMRVEGNAPNAADVPTLLGSGTFSLVDRSNNIESQKARHVASYLRWPHMHADQVRGLSLREIGGGFRKHHRAPSILSACHAIAKPSTMVQKMQNIKKLRGHRNAVYCAIFDRSGRYVITGSDDRLVKIWSMETALCLASCRGHEGDITDLAVSSNNALVASASNDFVIRVWRLPDGMPISVLRGHTGAVTAIAFSPRQASVYQLLSSSDDGTCRIWDARYSQWLPRIYVPSPSDANTGESTFTSSNTGSTSNASQSHQILCCAYNANGTIFVTGSSDSNARVWSASKPNLDDAEQPTHELDVLRGHENDVNYVQFSGCAVAPKSSTADALKEDSYPKFKNSWFCHDNIVTCSRDGSAIIWTPRSRKFHGKSGRWMKGYHLKVPPPPLPPQPPRGGPRQRFLPTPRGVNMIIWSLDNRFVLAAIMDCRICVWNAADGSLVHCLTGHSESSYVLDVHPFNPRIAMSAGYDGKTIIWDIWEGIPIKVYEIGRFKLVDGKFSQDGTSIVLSDDVGQIYFLNTGQGESQKNAKYDQFFLGDYRPLIRDTNGHVLDQETQLLPHRRNLQDLLCDSSMIPYPEPDQTMFQQRRLGALGVEWRPSSIKFSVGPDFSLGQDYIMPPLADLDRLIEPLPEFIDAMYWEPEHEVLSDDNDSEYNAEVSSDGARASPCSNSSNELECSSEDSDVENIHESSYHWKRMDAEKATDKTNVHLSSDHERCPVEEVALVVPETDDPSLPVMTFRAWFLGLTSCVLLIFLNTFFTYRTQPLTISAILMQIAVLPIGKFMARTLPTTSHNLLGWSFSLNPGPFNIKEHVIITIFANCGVAYGGGDAYSIGAITVMKAYYKQSLSFICGLFIVLTTQILGYGWAGILRRYLVDPVDMWWPSNLAQVSLFRALHEKENKSKGLTRMKFFLVALGASFIYYALPGYLFPILTFFSWVCWAWPNSITAQQVGSGYHGLGVGAFTLDWAGISAYHGSPLVAPWSSILNVGVGFIMFIYIIVPVCYWKFNTFDARKFPIFSNQLFTTSGQKYDTTKILTPQFDLDIGAYNNYGKLYLSPLFALSIGSGFARFTATLTHVALFNGRDIWKQTWSAVNTTKLDIHGKLMQSYKKVPEWWFYILLAGSVAMSLLMSFVWKESVQLPWWGMLFAFALAFIVTLPIGVIQATTNQQPGYDIIGQFIIGYILPGKPIANLIFKIYGRISTVHALSFLADLKLGHYMKIPPRCMYTAQLVGTVVAGVVNLGVAWWMLESIQDICDIEGDHPNSPWTCPKYRVTFDASVIWGLIGPRRLFGPGGMYRNLVWLFLIGAVLPVPVWALSKIFPNKKWIPLINIPVISYGFAGMPPATPTNIASWLVTGTIFNYFVFNYHKRWWQKYNYVLSAALDAGTAFMGVLLFFALQNAGHDLKWWGTEVDHCPLASCPTAPGIKAKGCPVF